MFLIDTNLVSEMFRPKPDVGVVRFLEETPRSALLLSSIVVGELYLGLALMPEGRRREALTLMIDAFVDAGGAAAILSFGKEEALHYAGIAARRRRMGRPITEPDAQIAAIAAAHRLPLVTRNVRDFEDCGIDLINPWEAAL